MSVNNIYNIRFGTRYKRVLAENKAYIFLTIVISTLGEIAQIWVSVSISLLWDFSFCRNDKFVVNCAFKKDLTGFKNL